MSGADLIKTSTHIHDRVERLRLAEPVAAVESPGQSGSALDDDTQNALMRFARFIKNEGQAQQPKPKKKGLSAAYTRHLEQDEKGAILNVYV